MFFFCVDVTIQNYIQRRVFLKIRKRAVLISDFHYMIIVAKQIHDNNIIYIYL